MKAKNWKQKKLHVKIARSSRKRKIIFPKGPGQRAEDKDLLDYIPSHMAAAVRYIILVAATMATIWVASLGSALMFNCTIGAYGYLVVRVLSKLRLETKDSRVSIGILILLCFLAMETIFCLHYFAPWYMKGIYTLLSITIFLIGMSTAFWEIDEDEYRRRRDFLYGG